MSTIQETVVNALTVAGVAGGRIYPLVCPNGVLSPNIIYQVVSREPQNTLNNGSPITNTRLQFDVWDITYSGAQSTANSLISVLDAIGTHIESSDGYDVDLNEYRVSVIFSFWS
ncbi:MAG: DUF3168 domain-containing protein [Magnetococcales bacterium]|nr:DUF3168 domain-containing protein [Magnetococcales bacterium]